MALVNVAASVAERIGLVLLPGAVWIEAVLETALELALPTLLDDEEDALLLDVALLLDDEGTGILLELDDAALLAALDVATELAAELALDDELTELATELTLLAFDPAVLPVLFSVPPPQAARRRAISVADRQDFFRMCFFN